MSNYLIHPIVMGSKVFDKGMMTYQFGYGEPYTIPIYCWYLEGGPKKVLIDTGELNPIQSEDRQRKIGGAIYTFEEGLARYGLRPEDIEVVIRPGGDYRFLHNPGEYLSAPGNKGDGYGGYSSRHPCQCL